jgi:hypothetical protein
MLIFNEITITDLPHIRRIVAETGYRSCQLSAGGLFCLAPQYRTAICFRDNFLFIEQCRPDVGVCYFMPIGTGNLATAIGKLKQYHYSKHSTPIILWGVADDMVDNLKSALRQASECKPHPCNDGNDLQLTPDRNWAEYIHEAPQLCTLRGKHFQPKRNAANQFRRNHPDFVYEPITAANTEAVWQFQQNHPQIDGKLDAVIRRGLDAFATGGFVGGCIRIGGKIEGYTFGCPINATDFDILFENANKEYNGIFQVLEQELIRQQLADYLYINREEDLGVEGIRFAKMGLHPDVLLMKYSVVV